MAVITLSVRPIYGSGWRDTAGSIEVPEPFELKAEVTEAGNPFRAALGPVADGPHPLAGHWILLSSRGATPDAGYNVRAFESRPEVGGANEPLTVPPVITGFAHVEPAG